MNGHTLNVAAFYGDFADTQMAQVQGTGMSLAQKLHKDRKMLRTAFTRSVFGQRQQDRSTSAS
jgi:hypothetical protein